MKRFLALVLITVMLLLLFGCGREQTGECTLEMTEEKRTELRKAIADHWDHNRVPNAGEGEHITKCLRFIYFGTYHGIDIVGVYQVFGVHRDQILEIGDEIFYAPHPWQIYIHQDGVFTRLAEAYDDGLLTDETLRGLANTYYDAKVKRFQSDAWWLPRFKELYFEYVGNRYEDHLSLEESPGKDVEGTFYDDPLTEEKRQQLIAAISEYWDYDLPVDAGSENWIIGGGPFYYYGSFHDCDIFICLNSEKSNLTLGEVTFRFSSDFFVMHEGRILTLAEAYETGLIGYRGLRGVKRYHNRWYEQIQFYYERDHKE